MRPPLLSVSVQMRIYYIAKSSKIDYDGFIDRIKNRRSNLYD